MCSCSVCLHLILQKCSYGILTSIPKSSDGHPLKKVKNSEEELSKKSVKQKSNTLWVLLFCFII
jgi:hypothetical protein